MKEYQKPEVEFISLTMQEAIATDDGDDSYDSENGLQSNPFG